MISAVITYDDKRVSVHTSKAKNVSNKFSKGFYEAYFDQNGNLIISEQNLTEIHEPFKSKNSYNIIKTVQSFFTPEVTNKVNKLGFTHKLGILLHGIAGTGKTSIINYISNEMMDKREAIVFFCNKGNQLEGAMALSKMIRDIQDNPIIFIADEFERYAVDYESEMKNFLDGNESINNMLFLAATNYIDRIPDTLKERPSRFRIVEEVVGIKDKAVMKEILMETSEKLQPSLMTEKEIDKIVAKQKTATIDQLKHICLDKLTDSFVKIKKRESIGFSSDSEDKAITNLFDLEELNDGWTFKPIYEKSRKAKNSNRDYDSNI